MADDEEDITIDLKLRDYLSGGAATAAREMGELADETKKAARALLLLDKRADKAAGSLYKLAAAAAAARGAQQQMLDTGVGLNKQMGEQIQTHKGLDKALGSTKKKSEDAAKSNNKLGASFKKLNGLMKSSIGTMALLAKGLAIIGAAGAAGGLAGVAAQQILAVGAALSTMLSFAALVPLALGALIAVVTTAKMAFGGLGKAIQEAGAGNTGALDKMFSKLPKEARALGKELGSALKTFKGMKDAVQGAFLGTLSKDVPTAIRGLQPLIRNGMKGIATELGRVVNSVAQYFTTENGKRMFGRFFEAGAQIVGLFSRNVGPLLEGLGDIIEAVQPSWDRFMSAADSGLSKFADWMSKIANDGSLKDWLDTAFEVAKSLWGVLKDLGGIIKGVVDAAGGAGSGAGALGALGTALGEINTWVNSLNGQDALQSFFSSLGDIATAVAPVLKIVAEVIGKTLLPAIGDFVTGLAPGAIAFFEALGQALEIIAPYMGPLGEAFGQLLTALSPLLPIIGQVAAMFAGHLATVIPMLVPIITMLAQAFQMFLGPALTFLFSVLQMAAPYIQTFFTLFMQIMQQLAPVIQQIGVMFGQFLAANLARMAELLPTLLPMIMQLAVLLGNFLVQALTMLAPYLPQIFQMFYQLAGVTIQLAPVVLQLATAFLQVATAALPLIGIALRVLGAFLTFGAGAATVISTVVGTWAAGVGNLLGIFGSIRNGISNLIGLAGRIAGPFVSAVGAIVGAFGRIGGAVSGAIGSIQNLISKASALSSIDINPFRFAGGDVAAGQKYTVGEIGAEMYVGKNGQTKMIGTNGMDPNWQAPGDGFIVPSFMLSAFKSMERGMDNMASKDSAVGVNARQLAAIVAGASQPVEEHYHVPVHIHGNVTQEIDIERAVQRGIEKAERDKKERG